MGTQEGSSDGPLFALRRDWLVDVKDMKWLAVASTLSVFLSIYILVKSGSVDELGGAVVFAIVAVALAVLSQHERD